MRDQGRLVEWFDDKGYGFIQPNDKHKDRVFLHQLQPRYIEHQNVEMLLERIQG